MLKAVEGADLVIDAGGVCFHDNNTTAYTQPDLARQVLDHRPRLCPRRRAGFQPRAHGRRVRWRGQGGAQEFRIQGPARRPIVQSRRQPGDPITVDAMYERYRDFLRPNDQIVIENGSSTAGIVPLPLPDGAQVHGQSLWGSIGWATAAAWALRWLTAHGGPCCLRAKARINVRRRSRHHGPQWA